MAFSNYTEESLFESLKILDIYQLNTFLTAMYSYHQDNLFLHFLITQLYYQKNKKTKTKKQKTIVLPMKMYILTIRDQHQKYKLNLKENNLWQIFYEV